MFTKVRWNWTFLSIGVDRQFHNLDLPSTYQEKDRQECMIRVSHSMWSGNPNSNVPLKLTVPLNPLVPDTKTETKTN
uniref:Uncharacterized protein n=1 Tax=Acrobeloides nanus TaxID=290746 RepID=A0A914E4X1_9BILA